MTCRKCGSTIAEGDTFCPNCGAPSVLSNATGGLQEISGAVQERKKKTDFKWIAYVAAAVVGLVFVIYGAVKSGQIDYLRTVQECTPFESIGYDYTCKQVFGRYMPNASWTVSEADKNGSVTISGPFLDANTFEVRIDVEPMENDEVYFTVGSGMIDGQPVSTDTAMDVMAMMWSAYDAGLTMEEFDAMYS